MKNAKINNFLPVGISALAILAFQAPLSAQEAGAANNIPDPAGLIAPEAATGEAATSMLETTARGEPGSIDMTAPAADLDAEVPALASPESTADTEKKEMTPQRILPDATDAYAISDVSRLDAMGIVGKQAAIGEDILIIDRLVSRAEAINTLVGYLGVEAFRLNYPELAEQLKDSPILLRADLAKVELQNKINDALNPEPKEEAPAPKPRDDGSSFFEMKHIEAPQPESDRPTPTRNGELDPAVTALIAEQVAAAQANAQAEAEIKAPKIEDIPISLREVYGLTNDFSAVIVHGDERIRVRAGDRLPNETVIEAIEEDSIIIRRHGDEIRIQIRG